MWWWENEFLFWFVVVYRAITVGAPIRVGFAKFILPEIVNKNKSLFEFRTKSIQLQPFINTQPIENIVLAYSLLPEELASKLDHKAPSIKKRMGAIKKLSEHGWQIGLRFDPLIYHKNWKKHYFKLFQQILYDLNIKHIHSISFGSLRFPKEMFKKIYKLYPEEKLFSYDFDLRNNYVSFSRSIEMEMIGYCDSVIKKYSKKIPVFSCTPY